MENTPAINTPNQNTSKKKHNKYFALTIVLAIVTLLGISFGVFGMVMNGQANQKAEALSNELAQKDTTLKQIEEKLGAQIEVETETSDQEDDKVTNVSVSAAKDYIYIGEWGIKIKIPKNLHSVSYVFYGGKNLLYVSGVVCGDGRCQYYPAFMENTIGHGHGMTALGRYSKSDSSLRVEEAQGEARTLIQGDGYMLGAIVYEDDEYYYAYVTEQMLVGTESERQWEIDSVEAIEKTLRSGISAF